MPTKAEALAELERVFALIEAGFREAGTMLPADTTEVVHAWCACRLGFERRRQIGSHERWHRPNGGAVAIPIHRGRWPPLYDKILAQLGRVSTQQAEACATRLREPH